MKFYNNISKRFLVLLSVALLLTDGSFAYPINVRADEIEEPIIETIPEELEPIEEIIEEIVESPADSENVAGVADTEEAINDETVFDEDEIEEECLDTTDEDSENALNDIEADFADAGDDESITDISGECEYIASAGALDFKNNSTVIGKVKLSISSWRAGAIGEAKCTSAIGTSEGNADVVRVPRYVLVHSEVAKSTLSENNAYKVRKAMCWLINEISEGKTVDPKDKSYAMFWDGPGEGTGAANYAAKDEFFANLFWIEEE